MQMTWFCMASQRRTSGRWLDSLLVCVKEDKVNSGKSKVMVLNGEEGLECEVFVDGICLEHVSEFKYLGCVLDKSGTDGENIVGKWRVGGGLQVPLGP